MIDYSINLLGTLRAILGAALFSIGNAGRIQGAAHNVITHTGQVFDTSATYQHHGVLLQLMTFTWDVRGHFDAICQTDTGDLAQCRIWLLGSHRTHDRADAALLRRALILAHATLLVRIQCVLQGRGFAFYFLILAALADHLVDCRHDSPPITLSFTLIFCKK